VTEISVFCPGGVSYLRIAAPDPGRSAVFYSAVFGWKIRQDSSAFEMPPVTSSGTSWRTCPWPARPGRPLCLCAGHR
jgi:hypothetical protein